MIYILILFAKIIEVSIRTIRTVLLIKGERRIAAIIGFFEILLWITIVTRVISDLSDDPLKAIVYALGFSIGIYVGSTLESKIGIGLSEIQANIKASESKELVDELRAEGFAVTEIKAEGQEDDRIILSLFVQRTKVNQIVYKITAMLPNAVITTSDVKPITGGYGLRRKKNGETN
ncbi:MAG TPA: DUF5698 domain-containing protein [Clostridia bacterium]|nr:DUF5698 domain-containing protein [Clostridia bacterium]